MNTPHAAPASDLRSLMFCLFVVGGGLMVFVAVVAAFLGRPVAEKVATSFLLPPGLIFIGLLTLVVQGIRSRAHHLQTLTATVVLLVFVAFSNGLVANWLMWSLERSFVHIDPLSQGPFETVVLLGGATGVQPTGGAQINSSGDRLRLAAALYHRGRVRTILCMGAAIAGLSTRHEGEQAQQLLMDLGVAKESIQVQGGRTTSEEMSALRKDFGGRRERMGVITSAWHMRRAMHLAADAGLDLEPLPADFRHQDVTQWGWARVVQEMVPNSGAMATCSAAVREYLARLAGR